MPEGLTATAEVNRANLVHQADSTDRRPPGPAFRITAATAVMGTAVRKFKLDIFHRLSHVACAREISAHHPDRPVATSPEDWYASNQGSHYVMRNAFEDQWGGGRQAIYFALLLEGLAPPGYGEYTLVVDPSRAALFNLACFPGNTAERYAPRGVLDSGFCRSEIAPWDLRGDLLTIKHEGAVPADSTKWADLVCHGSSFSEAVFIGTLPLAAVAEIRVDKYAHRRWRTLRVQMLSKMPLSLAEEDQVRALDLLDYWRGAFGTRIVDA